MEDTDFEYDAEDLELEQEEAPARNPARELQRKMEKELKESRSQLKAANDAKSEGEIAKRELAFIKAGIDTNNATAKLLLKTYDGELTMEAIKASGEEYGLIATSQTNGIASDLAAINQVSNASQGSSASVPASIFEELKAAQSPAEVLAVYAKNNMSVSYEDPGELFSLV